jgi:hypothetical protein
VAARTTGAAARWAAVAALVAALVALPLIVRALPGTDRDVSAADLRAAALASEDVGYSGYAVSAGGLALPVTDELLGFADLLSDRTTMRVWWRGPEQHRVDVVSATGETDLHRDPTGSWTWDYESGTATRADPAVIALPGPVDLLPPSLARRLLSEASEDELSRIGVRRVAGGSALGLRITPAEPAAAVSRVDVWVEPDSGLPVQVEVVAAGTGTPALDTRFLDLDVSTPPSAVLAFTPPPDALVRPAPDLEGLVAQAQRGLTPPDLPGELAGLPRRSAVGVPVGIYLFGRGVTVLAVTSLPAGEASEIRRALAGSPGAVVDDLGTRVAAGPVAVMVVQQSTAKGYVLAGTVTLDALADAARALPRQPS